jgi:hypothetical protein
MSEKEENAVIKLSKSQMRRIAKQTGHEDEITDEDFAVVLEALFGEYKGPGWNPE